MGIKREYIADFSQKEMFDNRSKESDGAVL